MVLMPPRSGEGGPVEIRSGAVGATPLVRQVRLALQSLEERFPGRCAGKERRVRRAAGGLLDRLERLRRAFPDSPELLERVELSPHLTRLLEESPLHAEGGPVG
jgi:hypothetical protein